MHFHVCLHAIFRYSLRFRGLVNLKIAFSIKTHRPKSVQQPTPVEGVALGLNACGLVALVPNATPLSGVGLK